MAKMKKNQINKTTDPKIKTIQKNMEAMKKKELGKPNFLQINTLIGNAFKSDDPLGPVKKAIKILRDEIIIFNRNRYKRNAFHAMMRIVFGLFLVDLQKAYDSSIKNKSKPHNWLDFLRKYFDQWSVRSCQEWMDLARTPEIHSYAIYGYTTMRNMQRVYKKLGGTKFNKFVKQHNLSLEDNQDVPLTEFKKRIKDILIAEGHIKGKMPTDSTNGGSNEDDPPSDKKDGKNEKGTKRKETKKAKKPDSKELNDDEKDQTDSHVKGDYNRAINDRTVNLYTDLSKKKVVKELDSDTRKNLKKLRARIGRILNDKK